MTAAIYTNSEHLFGVCSAYFKANGHTVQRIPYGEPGKADVVIIDHPCRASLPTIHCTLLVVISAEEVWRPPGSWSYRKPVDLDCMMDQILCFVERWAKHP